MRRARVLAMALASLLGSVVFGCSPPNQSDSSHPSPTAGLSGAGQVCRLPVSLGAVAGGWVDYPSGRFVEDPTAGGYLDAGVLKTKARPVLVNASNTSYFTYSRRLKRWLPSPPELVSPDGAAYLWTEYEVDRQVTLVVNGSTMGIEFTRIHITKARTGVDRILFQDSLYFAVALSMTAAYLSEQIYGGLVQVDLATGQLHQLSKEKFQWVIDRGYAWATDSGDRQQYDTLYRMDLASGAVQPFFARPGALNLMIVGINATGSLLVEVAVFRQPGTVFTFELWYASGHGSRLLTDNLPQLGNVWIQDSGRVWIGGDQGVYLWNGDQVTPVLAVPSTRGMVPVGACVA